MQRILAVLFLAALGVASPISSQEMEDVVYLRDGTSVRGTVIERTLGESLTIRGQDGSVVTYRMKEISRIVQEPVKGPEEQAVEPAQSWQRGESIGSTHKNPWLAFGLSALIPGTGQFYNEQPRKGLPQLGAAIAGSALVFFAARDNYEDIYGYWVDPDNDDRRAVYGGVLWLGGLLWSAIDAPVSANRINRKGQEGSGDQGLTLHLHPVLWRNAPGVRLVMR